MTLQLVPEKAPARLPCHVLESRESLLRTVAASDEEISALEAPGPGDSPDDAGTSVAAGSATLRPRDTPRVRTRLTRYSAVTTA